MQFPTRDEVESLRKEYPVGTQLTIDHMADEHGVLPGTYCRVTHVDDAGQIHVTGTGLAIVPGVDKFHKRFRVNTVTSEHNGKKMHVLVDTRKAGFPSPWQWEESPELTYIYDLCDWLNIHAEE